MADCDPIGGGQATCGSKGSAGKSTVMSSKKKSWIAIKLVDEDGLCIPGEEYRITLPDGTAVEDYLDEKGFARVDGIDPGTCQVTFPELDKEAWKPK